MTDISPSDRRTDIINNLAIRLAVLEATHTALMSTGNNHAALIDKLSNQDQALVLSLNSISIKFDSLIKQIGIGIKIILACSSILAGIIGAFYGYSRDLDSRYEPKLESIVTNTANQKHKLEATNQAITENTEKLNENSEKLNEQTENIKDVREKVGEVNSDVSAIKKLKAVRGSR